MVQGLLASAGIDAWIAADDAGGAFPFSLAGGAQVLVEENDLEAAAKVVAGPTKHEVGHYGRFAYPETRPLSEAALRDVASRA